MVFRISFALWHDPHWRPALRRSWKARRYWLAKPEQTSARGRVLAIQIGAYTFKWTWERGQNGQSTG